ncbi:5'-nucleotidase, C-terminal domain protein [Synechococcus sp. PCC 7335]|nr:5'-nucleotidase, C-terminal domain protein [Synechococcus sp. PCC 7335]
MSRVGSFDAGENGAEIITYDTGRELLYAVSGGTELQAISIADPTDPVLQASVDIADFTPGTIAGANSIAFSESSGLIAVVLESEPVTDNGLVVVVDLAEIEVIFATDGSLTAENIADGVRVFEVGALPDMVTFTPDGSKILVANEGEPSEVVDSEGNTTFIDPEGSISIIDVSGGFAALDPQTAVSTADFTRFNGRAADLRADGVRLFPDIEDNVASDLEPEYIAVSHDGTKAFVTLQENNAIAIVDIETATVDGIQPLGLKDFSQGLPNLTTYDFDRRGNINNGSGDLLTSEGDNIELGGFSGLFFDGVNEETGNLKFLAVPDRGPNGDADGDDRPFLLPDYQARVVAFELNESTGNITITGELMLKRDDGTPITGLPNIPNIDRRAVDASGNPVDLEALAEMDAADFGADYDRIGADLESVLRAPNGSLWMVDEYRPSIYRFNENSGEIIRRYVPEGTRNQANEANLDANFERRFFGKETLPTDYRTRRANRGFEGAAFDTDNNIFYAFIQTPLSNPDRETDDDSSVIRILGIDPDTGTPVAEYLYLLEDPEVGNTVDKIGDAVYAGDGKFFVIERDSSLENNAQKFIFEVDLKGATNILSQRRIEGDTPEALSPDQLAALGVQPVTKRKVTNLASLGYLPSDKPEGIALLPDGRIAILNDNDFGLVEGAENVQLGIIDFALSNGLDASDRDGNTDNEDESDDGAINIDTEPVFGLYMPDSIASFEANGETFYVIANEGDDRGDADEAGRGEAIRLKDISDVVSFDRNGLTLDESIDQALLADDELGRLTISSIDGDTDGDGDIDRLVTYGGRSFSVLDSNGNLVFDSGDQIAQITAELAPELFNANDGSPTEFDTRSDNKGAEPEAITTGVIDGTPYAFVGLERAGGGILVFDLSDPSTPKFEQYIRDDADIAPEGLAFILAEDSPSDQALLAVANEVSATVSIHEITPSGPEDADFTLELLHLADQEAGIPALDDAPNASAVLNALKADERFDNTLVLSSGDAFIPGLFFSSSEESFGGVGRADILIQNELGIQAIAFGNHEFDAGTGVVRDLVAGEILATGLALKETQQVGDTPVPDTVAMGEFSASLKGNRLTISGEFRGLTSELAPMGDADSEGNPPSAIQLRTGNNGFNGPILRNLTVELDDEDTSAGEFAGTFDLTDAETARFLADGTYVNLSTADNPAGELRGQIDINFESPNSDGLDFAGANFPYLSSNLDFSTDENLADLVVEDDQAPKSNSIAATTVIDVNGEKIGVVGATTPTLQAISNPDDVTVLPDDFDPAPTSAQLDALAVEIQTDVDELLAANPDINKVVLLSHMQQISIERELATRLQNVDIIVAGGSNTRLVDENDILRPGDTDQGPYPIFETDAEGNPVAVVNTDGNYRYIGRLVLDFNEEGVLLTDSYDPDVSGAYATDSDGVARLDAEDLVDPEIQTIVDELREVIIAKESNVFGVSDVYLNGLRGSVRIQETNLGNLTADANLAIAKGTDPDVVISIKNGGGIRDDIGRVVVPAGGTGEAERLPNEPVPEANKPEGGISETDISNALSFNNGLTLLTVTAEELLEIIEFGVGASSPDDGNTQGRFPQVAGIEFSFDLTQSPGDRVQSLVVLDEAGNDADVIVQDSELMGDPSRSFRLVTLGFLAGGGDGYPFPMGERADVVDISLPVEAERTGGATFAPDGTEQDALAEYLLNNFATEESAFAAADTSRAKDTRLQNLAFRADTVIDEVDGSGTSFTPGNGGRTVELTALDGASAIRLSLDNIQVENASEVRVFRVGDNSDEQIGAFSILEAGLLKGSFEPSFSVHASEGDRLRFEMVASESTTTGTVSIDGDGNAALAFGDTTLSLEIDNGVGVPNLVVDSEDNDGAAALDFTSQSGNSNVRFSFFREAGFDSTVGLYVIDDLTGQVTFEGETFQVSDDGYAAAALGRAVEGLALSTNDNGFATVDAVISSDLFGTYITVEDPNFANPQTYFSFLGANNGRDHVTLLGDNAIGFEDLPGLGDADFNDIVVSFAVEPFNALR